MIIRNSNNVVLYDNSWRLTDHFATNGKIKDRTTTTSNATKIEGQQLPSGWSGHLFSWSQENGFEVFNSAKYAEIVASRKIEAKAEIDAAAEERRQEIWLTPGDGQAQEYRMTEEEAYAAAAESAPHADDYPMLKAEQDALAAVGSKVTILEVAQLVLSEVNTVSTLAATIKKERREAKLKIGAATTVEDIEDALASGIKKIKEIVV